eukprot:m.601174 g.601174  ORF g.601174 m.601174 type:complete len:104 (-) comp22440_c0_seq3:170-481(-)
MIANVNWKDYCMCVCGRVPLGAVLSVKYACAGYALLKCRLVLYLDMSIPCPSSVDMRHNGWLSTIRAPNRLAFDANLNMHVVVYPCTCGALEGIGSRRPSLRS